MCWRTFLVGARKCSGFAAVLCLNSALGWAQSPGGTAAAQASSLNDSLRDLQAQVNELKSMLAEMHEEIARSREEALELHQELAATRLKPAPENAAPREASLQLDEQRLVKLEEEQTLLSSKIDEQYQSKVESGSKYRVRLSGIALLNLFTNNGTVDNIDFPAAALQRGALDSGGNFGATMRQSEVGLEVFGPQIRGAKVSADLQMDFAGGVPEIPNGVNTGLFRLRTATVRLDWAHTSIIAGQDALFISPLSPTSLASLAVPALSYAGNLWAWTPQVRIEHRLDLAGNSSLLFQGGILDGLDGELPQAEYLRLPQAGEQSRQPAYGTRVAWSRRAFGRTMSFGAAGYYSRQNWGLGRSVDGWAGLSDWLVPFASWLELSGEFYRGRGIGGLGAAFGRSTVWSGPIFNPSTVVHGLDSTGGWAQLKFKPAETYEFNAAFGQDSSQASEIRRFPNSQTFYDPGFSGNRSWMANVIYHPRSDLLFSVEYRRLRTFSVYGASEDADHINLAIGVLF